MDTLELRELIKHAVYEVLEVLADREGFEPSVTLRLRVLSRDVVSANSPTGP